MMDGLDTEENLSLHINKRDPWPISSAFAFIPQLKPPGHHNYTLDSISRRPATALVAGPSCGFYPVAAVIHAGQSLNIL